MRHDLTIEGCAFRLRPADTKDAKFILGLRCNPELNQYLHVTSSRIEDQLAWFENYFQREGDYYFVLERRDNGVAEGLISVYNQDSVTSTAEWGRWILLPGSLGAIESAWLIYRVAFEILRLQSVYSRTLIVNSKVVSFHESCGIEDSRILHDFMELNGVNQDAVEHRVSAETWSHIEPRLRKLSQQTSRRIISAKPLNV